jgi:hypothetical protein
MKILDFMFLPKDACTKVEECWVGQAAPYDRRWRYYTTFGGRFPVTISRFDDPDPQGYFHNRKWHFSPRPVWACDSEWKWSPFKKVAAGAEFH